MPALAIRLSSSIQTKIFAKSQRTRRLASVLADLARLEENGVKGIYAGEASVDWACCDGVSNFLLRKFFTSACTGMIKLRVPMAAFKTMRCFMLYFLEKFLSQGINAAIAAGTSDVTKELLFSSDWCSGEH